MPIRPFRLSSQTTLRSAMLAAAFLVAAPAAARAQRVGGSMGVSLTILEPVATQAVEVTGFRLDRDGRATLETTAPTRSPISQVVMARVSSSANGFQPVAQEPVLVRGDRPDTVAGARTTRMSYRVDVGRSATPGTARDVQLRIEYLAVAGT